MAYLESSNGLSHLLVIEDIKGRRTISLEEMRYCIGRHSSNHIVIFSQQASRFHATLIRRKNNKTNSYSYWIVDGDLEGNKSYNGIYINGKKSLVSELQDGDLINFGCEVNASYHHSQPYLIKESPASLDSPTLHNTEDTVAEQTYMDETTQLANESLYKEYLSIAVNNAAKSQKILGIILFRLENFSNVKGSFDSEVTDKVLYTIGERLKSSVRSVDIVFYLENYRFVILLPELNGADDIEKIHERIFTYLNHPFLIDENSIDLEISSSFALYPWHTQDSKNLITLAEERLRQPQPKPTDTFKTQQLSKIENLLHEALHNREFDLYYQPQINLDTEEIESLEVLLRWVHPKFGVIAPAKFLGIAEETDLILPLTDWVIKTACQQSNVWKTQRLFSLPLSINISAHYFESNLFLDKFTKILAEFGQNSSYLEIELHENALLKDLDAAKKVLERLNVLGVTVTLDDFGLGYSALSCLDQLPIHKLKIAQTLISNLKTNPENNKLIATAIALGNIFNLEVVAEGVETQEQLDILKNLGCVHAQGNFFSKPISTVETTQMLFLTPRK